MRQTTIAILCSLALFVTPVSAMGAGELSGNCNAVTLEHSSVWGPERSGKSGICLGYLNAVRDLIEDNPDLEVVRDFNVSSMMDCLQRYAPRHDNERADKAVVNALIGEGYLKRRPN
jgi:hypothetical protein